MIEYFSIGLLVFVIIIVAIFFLSWRDRRKYLKQENARPTEEQILDVLARIQEKYFVTISSEGDFIHLDIKGVKETFRLTVSKKERILFSDAWHMHFDDPPFTIESLLEGLFSGTVHIIVKFRGDKPVGQRVKVIQDKEPSYISWTSASALVSPFWRSKSYKTFTYEAANKTINSDS